MGGGDKGFMKKNEKTDSEEIKEKIKEAEKKVDECEDKKEEIEKEVNDYKAKADEYYEQLLRLKAEFENYRKRVEKEKKELLEWGRYDLMQHMLPVYEMMNMAKDHLTSPNSSIDDIKTGLNMIFAEFDKLFKSEGLTQIDILNKKYDPMLCEIVATVDGSEEDDNKVVDIVQPGYLINGRLIKPAKVKIAKKKEEVIDDKNLDKSDVKKEDSNHND
jgi:molecular chaperone GrpE